MLDASKVLLLQLKEKAWSSQFLYWAKSSELIRLFPVQVVAKCVRKPSKIKENDKIELF